MISVEISSQVARRFLLGRSGLWPGRRWRGVDGAAEAIHAMGALQLDPVVIVARSHELALWSRVLELRPETLDRLQHDQRRFFDYGTHLDVYPMADLRHWRLHMARRAAEPDRVEFAATHRELLRAVRELIAERGPSLNRDITGNAIARSYRGGKDSSLALYHLWLTGELMTARRRGFERYYDLASRIVPAEHDHSSEPEVAEEQLAVASLRRLGLTNLTWWSQIQRYALHRPLSRREATAWMLRLVERSHAVAVAVEGQREPWYILAEDLPALHAIARDESPTTWAPLESTTEDEAVFLSPLDPVIHVRDRTETLFGFFYRWEIYVPEAKRAWGAYTLPVLWRDELVGRIDSRLDRARRTLVVNRLGFERPDLGRNADLRVALAAGLARFAAYHEAETVDLGALGPGRTRAGLAAGLRRHGVGRVVT
jgi:uncharacterized protein YcaQ